MGRVDQPVQSIATEPPLPFISLQPNWPRTTTIISDKTNKSLPFKDSSSSSSSSNTIMASLSLSFSSPSSTFLSHCSSTSPPPSTSYTSSSAVTCLLPSKYHGKLRFSTPPPPSPPSSFKPERLKKHIPRSSPLDEVSDVIDSIPPPPPLFKESKSDIIKSLKLKLLSTVSGLNKGLVANEDDLRKADAAAKEIEAAGEPVDLSGDLEKLQGRWKLVYSSAFSSRTLGGSRPGPPIGRLLPITLGQVFQRIDILNKDFDNIVELQLGTPWPLPPVEVTATLAHKFEIIGSSTVKIIFEKTSIKTTGSLSQLPTLEIPQIPEALRPSSNRGSGEFEVTYLDSDTRITRGDRGELRVFVIS